MKRVIWSLKKKEERRFRLGHPWVFGNELGQVEELSIAGAEVELRDSHGSFLALGYGNRKSLITFREWSREEGDRSKSVFELLCSRLENAALYRKELKYSQRIVFGEADRLPGLVIDRYRSNDRVIYVVQVTTAGAETVYLPQLIEAMQALKWLDDRTTVLLDQTSRIRELEGLEIQVEKTVLFQGGAEVELSDFTAHVSSGCELSFDLLKGQKTGLFLDQQDTIRRVNAWIERRTWPKGRPIRVLDVCSYVGAWGVQISQKFKSLGYHVEWTALDASENALKFSAKNADRYGIPFQGVLQDMMKDWNVSGEYDLVIVDPPALIKNKKSHSQGKRAYQQINQKALTVLAPGGWLVSCSCSYHLSEWELREVLGIAELETGKRVRWFDRGTQSADHPLRSSFPEGLYLKSWIGERDADI